jgi:hypothetical protein
LLLCGHSQRRGDAGSIASQSRANLLVIAQDLTGGRIHKMDSLTRKVLVDGISH